MKTGVLVAQLGTPDAPTTSALRPYLKEFLSDRRVVDYHPLIWQPILQAILLIRPSRSAEKYKRIWTKKGSPLLVHSVKQAEGLQRILGDKYKVVLGMRYGGPSIQSALNELQKKNVEKIVVLPMYPQYSSTTTASIYDAVLKTFEDKSAKKRFVPALHFVPPFFNNPLYINAMRIHLLNYLKRTKVKPDKFVITFHGIPRRFIEDGDPYKAQCEETGHLLAKAMKWKNSEWILSFQSRFGPEPWLEPYTEDVLKNLSKEGARRPVVFSPGFVSDCLETLDELGNEGKEQFIEGGGKGRNYFLVPCLNEDKSWLKALSLIVKKNL